MDQALSALYPRVDRLEQSNQRLQQELASSWAREEVARRDAADSRARVEALEQYLATFESRLNEVVPDAAREAAKARDAAAREVANAREAAARAAADKAKVAAELDEQDCDINPFLPKEATESRREASGQEE